METYLDDKVRAAAVDQLIEIRTEPPQIVRTLYLHRGGIGRWRLSIDRCECVADCPKISDIVVRDEDASSL